MTHPALQKTDLLALYGKMQVIRVCEERLAKSHQRGLIHGAGYGFKLLKSDCIAVAFFGDGAVNNGAFHEGLNMAGVWKLPVLFVCENNQFATEVPFESAAGNPTVAQRGAAYGLPGIEVDG